MTANNKTYFKDVAKKGYLLAAVFLAAVAFTAIVASYEYGIFGDLVSAIHAASYLQITLVLFLAITLIYLFASLKIKHLTVADSVYFALVLIGVAYLIYMLIGLNEFNTRRVLFAVIVIVLGAILTSLRSRDYLHAEHDGKIKRTTNEIKNYYLDVLNKYSVVGIVVAAGVTMCATYILFHTSLSSALKEIKYLIVAGICLIPSIIFLIRDARSKTVTLLDALLLSGIISMPMTGLQIFKLDFSPLRGVLWASVFGIYLIVTFVRYRNFDHQEEVSHKPVCGYYFNSLFKNYDICAAFAIGGIIALAGSIILRKRLLQDMFFTNGQFDISIISIPSAIVIGTALISLAFFALTALIGIKNKKAHIGDFFLAICTSFVMFTFITLLESAMSPYARKTVLPLESLQ